MGLTFSRVWERMVRTMIRRGISRTVDIAMVGARTRQTEMETTKKRNDRFVGFYVVAVLEDQKRLHLQR